MFRRRKEKLLNRFAGIDVLLYTTKAKFFGQKSKGMKKIRGNGVLVLTPNLLSFEIWFPKNKLSIDLSSITKVEQVDSFLGKTDLPLLLKITFANKEGNKDEVAWLVNDIKLWLETLEQAITMKNRYK